jgi:hypothetical protein
MNRYSVIASIALVLAAGYIWYQQSQIAELKSGVFERDKIFERDKECAAQAQKLFAFRAPGPKDVAYGFTAGYSSHFSPKFNKCFMRLNIGSAKSQDFVVVDAFEQREYAHYYALFVEAAMRVTQCDVSVPGLPERRCTSEDEWEQLITPLMGKNQP